MRCRFNRNDKYKMNKKNKTAKLKFLHDFKAGLILEIATEHTNKS